MNILIKGIAWILTLLPTISFLVLSLDSARFLTKDNWIAKVKAMFLVLVIVSLCQIGTVLLFI